MGNAQQCRASRPALTPMPQYYRIHLQLTGLDNVSHLVICFQLFVATGWIEISFTTYSQEFFLEPSFETRYPHYRYSFP